MSALVLLLLLTAPYPKEIVPVKFGCSINAYQNPGVPPYNVWHLHTWIEHKGGKWIKLHSIRESRAKSLKDCEKWMKAVEKHIRSSAASTK